MEIGITGLRPQLCFLDDLEADSTCHLGSEELIEKFASFFNEQQEIEGGRRLPGSEPVG